MKRVIVLLLSAVMIMAFCFTAFGEEAAPETDPVLGSWKLDAVYEVKEGQEPALLPKEENQSLYGAGISILNFDTNGYAKDVIFDAGDMAAIDANWALTEDGLYEYKEEEGISMTFRYDAEGDTLHRSFEDFDFVYTRAIVGSWKLDVVLEMHEGDAPDELPKEGNQSLYGSDEMIFTFNADGTAVEVVPEGPNAYAADGTWEMTGQDQILYEGFEYLYFMLDDTLYRDIKDESPDATHPYLRFVYVRADETPDAESAATEEAPDAESAATEEAG